MGPALCLPAMNKGRPGCFQGTMEQPCQIFVLRGKNQPPMAEIFGSNTAQQFATAAIPVLNWQEVVMVPANQFSPSYAQIQEVQDVDTLAGPIGSLDTDTLQ